jgi:hypothetical protein
MTVEIWYGRWPKAISEQNALVDLHSFLQPQEEHFIIMTQFAAGPGNEIDLAIFKPQAIFIIELKSAHGKLVGRAEGDWKIIQPDGTERKLPSNPVKQIKMNYWQFKEWCEKNISAISEDRERTWLPEYSKGMYSYIVVSPDLHPESQVELPYPIEIVGLNKFLNILMMRSSSILNLSREEMERIPRLLKLTKWSLATVKLGENWSPTPYIGLVAIGHNDSIPILNFNRIKKEMITIGRNADNDLTIENETVSHHHARIRAENNVWVIEDLSSKNGTYLNFKGEAGGQERSLEPGKLNSLKHHSIIRFGQVRFMFLNEQ